MSRVVLKGRVIDAVSDAAIEDGIVSMNGETIEYVGPAQGYTVPEGADVREVPNGTIMPGFIDVHAHLTGREDAGKFNGGRFFGDQLLGAAHQVGLLLDAGFTGIRDMSEAGLYVSRAVDRGIVRGPRIMPGGRLLSITSGHVDLEPHMSKEVFNQTSELAILVDGVEECLYGVREQFRKGAKFIKICATGGISSPIDDVHDIQFSPEELRAIVGEAKRHNSYVAAHCTGHEGAYEALHAGVDCIEHGVMLTEREIDLMAEMDATLVTTLSVSLGVANMPEMPEWITRKAKDCAEANLRTIEMARKAGIRIALGTDFSNSRNTPYLKNGREFEAMTRAGMTPMEAIKAGTVNAAYLMRMQDQIGTLEQGKLADVVVVEGNPLEDIHCLTDAEHVKLVYLNGELKKDATEA